MDPAELLRGCTHERLERRRHGHVAIPMGPVHAREPGAEVSLCGERLLVLIEQSFAGALGGCLDCRALIPSS